MRLQPSPASAMDPELVKQQQQQLRNIDCARWAHVGATWAQHTGVGNTTGMHAQWAPRGWPLLSCANRAASFSAQVRNGVHSAADLFAISKMHHGEIWPRGNKAAQSASISTAAQPAGLTAAVVAAVAVAAASSWSSWLMAGAAVQVGQAPSGIARTSSRPAATLACTAHVCSPPADTDMMPVVQPAGMTVCEK